MISPPGQALARLGGVTCRLLAAAAATLLGGCLHVQLGGAVTEADISVTPLRDPANLVEQTGTPTVAEVRLQRGAEKWDTKRDIGRFVFLGNVILDEQRYDPGTLYLVTAGGGLDQDADANNALDDQPTPINGQWHAILTGEQLSRGKVSPLTEAIYRYLELNLDNLSDEEILAELDTLARTTVADIDGSGSVDYEDILGWHRHFTAGFYLRDISLVDELSEAIRGSAAAATLRELSLAVIGRSGESAGPYTVSGTVNVPPTTRIDSDVNDTNTNPESNNSFVSAQPMDNPVVVGGFLARPGFIESPPGQEGNFDASGDIDDFYRANLLAGQRITLFIGDDVSVNDLDLYLYDSPADINDPLDASLGISELEQLTIPADGEYYIRVNAFSGASNYQLSIGIGSAVTSRMQLKLSDDFVPGQVIASFRDHPRVNTMARRARFAGMRIRGGGLRRANLLEMNNAGLSLNERKLRTLIRMKQLRRQPEVEDAGLNYRVQAAAIPNDPFYRTQSWHYEQINLPLAWDLSKGDGTIVAVIDTGIRRNHPDLRNKLVQGWDFFDNTFGGGDNNPEDPGDSEDGTPSSFHGTHVAGTVAAATDNGSGVAGVAWNASIMPIRVLGPGGGTNYGVLQGVRYAAGLQNDSGTLPARAADVINLSLAGGGYSSFDQAVYREVAQKGIIVVAAAGNESTSQLAYPASYDEVISVSATNIYGDRARYSNFGSRVDVAAPGGDGFTPDGNGDGTPDLVLSTSADDSTGLIRDNYRLLQGTSMASPHVAGVMALMKALYPALDTDDVEMMLAQELITDDLGSAGRDNTFGWGLINANKAVLAAASLASGGGLEPAPAVTTSASSLNFGTFTDELSLTVSNAGTGDLVVSRVESTAPWLIVEPATGSSVDSNGVGTYSVQVDRAQLAVGSYTADIDIFTNDRNISVQVIVQQPDPATLTEGNASIHYILLINPSAPAGEEVQAEAVVSPTNGVYAFTFADVPPGRYQIIGGSDIDNDFFICDPGEACGAWPVLDSDLPVIEVIQDLNGLRFSSTFTTGIISTESTDQPGESVVGPRRRSSYRANPPALSSHGDLRPLR